jgi:hypothetical protein
MKRVCIAWLAAIVLPHTVVAAGRNGAEALTAPVLALGPIWTSEMDLHWSTSDSVAALTFTVERSMDGVTFTAVRSVAHDTLAAVSGLAPSTAYWFRVAASDSSGTSPYSNVVQAVTNPCGTLAFTAPPSFDSSSDIDESMATIRCGTTFDRGAISRAHDLQLDLPPCALGACDLPANRDGTPRRPIEVRFLVHVMRESDGTGGVPSANVDSMIAQINRDFAPHAIRVTNLATRFHDDSRFATISTLQQLSDMKGAYAERPSENLNLFVSAASGLAFDGRGTYPWDPNALTPQGGIWLHQGLVDGFHHAASHELGHCLGLYHTFHGTYEVPSCADACYEPTNGADADLRGDLCSDTRSTPRNFTCTTPTGCDCTGTPWGATPLHNIMGYGPAACINEFTPQQERRMLCWASALGTIVVSLAEVKPSAVEGGPLLWTGGITAPDGTARVWFTVPSPGRATLVLFDARGRRVVTLADRDVAAGRHESRWDGRDGAGRRVSPGVYWLRIDTDDKSANGRLIVIH